MYENCTLVSVQKHINVVLMSCYKLNDLEKKITSFAECIDGPLAVMSVAKKYVNGSDDL